MENKPIIKIQQQIEGQIKGSCSYSDPFSHHLIQSLSDFNRANQEPKNEENCNDFSNPSNPLFNHPDNCSHPLINSLSNYDKEEQKNKIIEVINLPLNNEIMGQRDISEEFSNIDLSNIIENENEEESEENEEESVEYEEIEKMEDKKKMKKKI